VDRVGKDKECRAIKGRVVEANREYKTTKALEEEINQG
jgi:hypothetical protein